MKLIFKLAAVMGVCAAAAAAQPRVATKNQPAPAPVARKVVVVKPQVYRLPAELTGTDPHPFATEFYPPSKKAKKPAAKKPARTAQRESGSI